MMRASEWIQGGFATILAIMAWLRPVTLRRRAVIALFAVFAIFVITLACFSERVLTPDHASILRDWLPVVLMLVPYWQTGQFFLGPNERIQARLKEIDRRLFNLMPQIKWTSRPIARLLLEWAYMFCYPQVPLGLAMLYAAGLRQYASTYWFIVLVPTYICYAITPFVPALPPRSLTERQRADGVLSKSRVMNLWILRHGSIQAISFPSAHVASALAVSCVLVRFVPIAGAIFLVVSIGIAVAAVAGGYHYAIDVLLGALMTLLVLAAWYCHLIPSSLVMAPAATFATRL
jgi:membrane-associated phospholipid phosphatase